MCDIPPKLGGPNRSARFLIGENGVTRFEVLGQRITEAVVTGPVELQHQFEGIAMHKEPVRAYEYCKLEAPGDSLGPFCARRRCSHLLFIFLCVFVCLSISMSAYDKHISVKKATD